ncbi:hypothetical protein, partial [Kineococcus glutinatus]|uniref:hypothetical protein n=1 Tax=Kineococcus glutinatus TaxID=1070872 RepID=UPI0031E6621E
RTGAAAAPAAAPARRAARLPAAVRAVLAVLASAFWPVPAAGATGADGGSGPVVLVGFSGVRWADVDAERTPGLWSMVQDGAIGTVAVRSVYTAACPGDGWLALSAGRRATDFAAGSGSHTTAPCAQVPAVTHDTPAEPALVAGVQPEMARYRSTAAAGTFGARPGLLGEVLGRNGVRTAAVGPGAGIALADLDGDVTVAPADGDSPDDLAAAVRLALAGGAALVVVAAGVLRDPADLPAREPAPAASRAEQVAAVDARVAAVLAAVPDVAAGGATVLATSLADAGATPHLQFAAALGRAPDGGYEAALLGSRATRQDGIVQTTDLTPTLLDLVLGPGGHEAADLTGQLVGAPVNPVAGSPEEAADRVRKVRDLDQAAQAVQPLIKWFFSGLVAAQILLYVVATLAVRRHRGGRLGRARVLAWMRRVAVVCGTVPAATFLANLLPWWRAGTTTASHLAAVSGAVALFVAGLTAVALLGPWRRHPLGPAAVVGAMTATVLTVDVATGTHLSTSSLIGLQPVVAGRFYGLGNTQFALFATGALLLTVALADRLVLAGRRAAAVAVVVVLGVVATYVDGVVGSDFGGPPAILPAFALLALAVAGIRMSWRRALALGAGTVVVISAIAAADWLRPAEERTHLGRFVQTVLDGGAWQVVQRKGLQNLHILVGSVLTLMLPPAAAFVAFVLMRPSALGVRALQRTYDHHPVLRPGCVAMLVLWAVGFAVNDSGTTVPAVGAMLALPLLIAAAVRTLEVAEPTGAGGAPVSREEPAPPATRG